MGTERTYGCARPTTNPPRSVHRGDPDRLEALLRPPIWINRQAPLRGVEDWWCDPEIEPKDCSAQRPQRSDHLVEVGIRYHARAKCEHVNKAQC